MCMYLPFFSLVIPSLAFYLPGVSPREYQEGEPIELKVNEMSSTKTQLPFSYYTLPVCKPPGGIVDNTENIGELLHGDLIQNSPFSIRMLEHQTCQFLCSVPISADDKKRLRSMIDEHYMVNWIVDSIPAAIRVHGAALKVDSEGRHQDLILTTGGFPVGVKTSISGQERYYLHNHFTIRLFYHTEPTFEGYRIVGFEVEPRSISQMTRQDDYVNEDEDASQQRSLSGEPVMEADCVSDFVVSKPFSLDAKTSQVIYTYDVEFRYSEVRWASRWDIYLSGSQGAASGQIHWFSIINNLLIALFLTGMVAMILLRTLHRDIAKYNEGMGSAIIGEMSAEEAAEESGWKLVHADVFRPPLWRKLFSATLGSGAQLVCMAFAVVVLAGLGFLSPVHRGAILQGTILIYLFFGIVSGYVSARFYKSLDSAGNWKLVTILAGSLFPAFSFCIFFVLNLLIWGTGSSGAVPFATMFVLLVLWMGVSLPLVFLGAHLGFKKEPFSFPCRVNAMPRNIPKQAWYLHPGLMCALGGILPFGAVFTELFFIMSSIWQRQIYYLFGFVIMVVLILVVTCAEVSIALTYFQLTAENYNWWWRSFFVSATSGLYVFGYSVLYFLTRLQMPKVVSILLYYGYMLLASCAFSLLTGTVGTISTFIFIRKIYGSVKVD